MRVLVTGSGGFLGSHVVAELKKRGHIIAEAHRENLGNKERIKKLFNKPFDAVVHCAAITHEILSGLPRREVRRVNVIVSKQLIDICSEKKIKFIFFSSAAVYNTSEVITAETKENPTTIYGREKLEVQQYLYRKKGLDFAIIFPSFPFGKGQPKMQLIPKLKNSIINREQVFVRDDGGPYIQPSPIELYGELVGDILRRKHLGGKKHFVTGDKTYSMLMIIMEMSVHYKIAPRLIIKDTGGYNYVFKS